MTMTESTANETASDAAQGAPHARRPYDPLSGEEVPEALLADMHLRMIARNCVHTAQFLKTTPAALELYVDQEPTCWHIRSRTQATTTLPSGSGQLAWDPVQYPTVETAFQTVLTQTWQAHTAGQR
jgi:hypothetical protein